MTQDVLTIVKEYLSIFQEEKGQEKLSESRNKAAIFLKANIFSPARSSFQKIFPLFRSAEAAGSRLMWRRLQTE